jgi:hypothetical protein
MKIRYEYSTSYNFRPDELYGMGKESLRVQSPREGVPIEQFLDQIQKNSSIKHVNHHQIIYGSDIVVEMEDWKPWIGQPMFYITDIKVEIVDG